MIKLRSCVRISTTKFAEGGQVLIVGDNSRQTKIANLDIVFFVNLQTDVRVGCSIRQSEEGNLPTN